MAETCLGKLVFEASDRGDDRVLSVLFQSRREDEIKTALRWRKKWKALGQYKELDGRNALSAAAGNGHTQVVRFLAARGALQIEAEDRVRFDVADIFCGALYHAFKNGQLETAKALLDAGADSSKDLLFHALVHWFSNCQRIYWSLLTVLKEVADVDQVDDEGRTALMIACIDGKSTMVEQLLEHGASPNVQDFGGETPLHLIQPMRFDQLGKMLFKHGAIFHQNYVGLTPLTKMAVLGRHKDVESILSLGESKHTPEDIICALELTGSSLILGDHRVHSYRDLTLGFQYLRRAMALRAESTAEVAIKLLCFPAMAYDLQSETVTMSELDILEGDSEALEVEALLIRERLLTPAAQELYLRPQLIRYAEKAVKNDRLEKAALITEHALNLQRAEGGLDPQICDIICTILQKFSDTAKSRAGLIPASIQRIMSLVKN
ncbi:protein fem-1 homolog A-like [Diadema setosum]|uniref:protein fem-1 homolog A-like n=1 Tax=Diadema setosum TaxID=31175 RepID=UPI003B3A8CCD